MITAALARTRTLLTPLALLLTAALLLPAAALAAGDINHPEACGAATEDTPGFTSSLPDCRAYELVSPPYGAGTIAAGAKNNAPPISPDGEHLLGIAFGDFAGTEELGQALEEYGEIYEFSRTPTGWIAEPQNPPGDEYPFHHLEGWAPNNLAQTVWAVPAPLPPGEQPERLWFRKNDSDYILRQGRGDFATIGPVAAPGHETSAEPKFGYVEGISTEAKHIAITDLARWKQLWPGDSTEESETIERPSLYEYHGTEGGEPTLVGVSNDTPAPWQPGAAHINEGAQLESQCGTAYDEMSTDGDTIFFTALHEDTCKLSQPPVDELYARVDGSHTVAISEPSKEACPECNGTGAPAPATFAGASEDGSVAFFTTGQALAGGRLGETTGTGNLYEYELDHTPSVSFIAPNVSNVARVSADGTHVYFTSTSVLATPANANGESAAGAAQEGASSFLYVYDTATHRLAFVARGEGSSSFDATADGQYLVFSSEADLQGTGDTSTVAQLFEYDAASGTLTRVSSGQHRSPASYPCPATGTDEEGYDCNGNTSIAQDAPRITQQAYTPSSAPSTTPVNSIAEDGTVVFTSELPLTPGAVQGRTVYAPGGAVASHAENVYEYRAGQVYLLSPGNEPTPAHYENANTQTRLFGIDQSGQDVFFSSVDQLVPQDTDTQSSWYDARELGGFPAPAPLSECAGETCLGPRAPAPVLSPPLTPGAGETTPPPAAPAAPAKAMTNAQIRAQELSKALKSCRRKTNRRKRRACEATARHKYAPKAKKTSKR